MRALMAVMVLSLGVVSVWAGGRGKPTVPGLQPPGKHSAEVTVTSSVPRLGSSANPKRAQEGQDFPNSTISEGRGFKGVGNKFLFRWINPGTFKMGSTPGTDPDRFENEVWHEVKLSRGFWILDHEVTQREYKIVVGSNPSKYPEDWEPVSNVTWFDAVEFCRLLTNMDRQKGVISATQAYRLPTEAEWEYAARAGTTGARYTVEGRNVADSLELIAWFTATPRGTHEVMLKHPNAWLLWDMLGNVSEWCSDWYEDYLTGLIDPTGPTSGSLRVNRGGSWGHDARFVRSASRLAQTANTRDDATGFRPVLGSVR